MNGVFVYGCMYDLMLVRVFTLQSLSSFYRAVSSLVS